MELIDLWNTVSAKFGTWISGPNNPDAEDRFKEYRKARAEFIDYMRETDPKGPFLFDLIMCGLRITDQNKCARLLSAWEPVYAPDSLSERIAADRALVDFACWVHSSEVFA